MSFFNSKKNIKRRHAKLSLVEVLSQENPNSSKTKYTTHDPAKPKQKKCSCPCAIDETTPRRHFCKCR